MGYNAEEMIKKAISEEIIEEMFRDLGFFVHKMGKEYTVSPLKQLESFIGKVVNDHGRFQVEKPDKEWVGAIDFVNRLPDFCIVNKFGTVDLIEVKYRHSGQPTKEDFEVFDSYDQTALLIINSYYYYKNNTELNTEQIEDLKNSRFHIYEIADKDKANLKGDIAIYPLEVWLKGKYDIEESDIIRRYENFVNKWLSSVIQSEKKNSSF